MDEQFVQVFQTIDFGKLKPYIEDDLITDINCNSRQIWVNHIEKGRYRLDFNMTSQEIEQLGYIISNIENKQFNPSYQTLEADFNGLRFHFTHPSFTTSGASVSIRKTPVVQRIHEENFEKNRYCTAQVFDLLKNCIHSQLSSVVCGMTGAGKTELCKFLVKFTNDWERVITIEDTLELHLTTLYPHKDIVEMKVNERIDYADAIKSCLRMLPTWMLLSEARGKEIKDLLKSISTGGKIITTIHAKRARDIPSRMLNMFEDNELSNDKIENMIFSYIDIGVHVSAIYTDNSTFRFIDEITYFELNGQEKKTTTLYKGYLNNDNSLDHFYYELPQSLIDIFEEHYIKINWKSNTQKEVH